MCILCLELTQNTLCEYTGPVANQLTRISGSFLQTASATGRWARQKACTGNTVYIFCCDISCLTPPQNSMALDTVHNSKLGTRNCNLGTKCCYLSTTLYNPGTTNCNLGITNSNLGTIKCKLGAEQHGMQGGSGRAQSQLV